MALVLTIDGTDRTSLLVHETLRVSQTADGLNSTCVFVLIDKDVFQPGAWTVGVTKVEDGSTITGYTYFFPDTKVEVSVVDGTTTYFAGVLNRVGVEHQAAEARLLHCACSDFNILLEESVVDTLEEYTDKTDEHIIDDIFANYVVNIDFATFVDGGAYTFDEISFENMTVRQVLDAICAQSECVWYIDYSRKLHYSQEEDNVLDWFLSDSPDDVSSFSFFEDISQDVDSVNLTNRVFIVGSSESTWFTDADSITLYGSHRAVVRDTSLIDSDDIAARGAAILAKYKDPRHTYSLGTYKAGARAGVHVRVVCAFYDLDSTLLINSLDVTFPDDGDPVYRITCGGLISSTSASVQRLLLDAVNEASVPIESSQLVLASQGWTHNLAFSATDADTVAWGSGAIKTASGATYSIVAGHTGNMAAVVHYVYLDIDISTTVLQTTISYAAAVGGNRILIAVCAPATDATEARFQVFGGGSGDIGVFITADNIAADTITANELAVNSVTAAEINVALLSAISANMGSLTAGTITGGTIRTAASPAARVEMNASFLAGYSDAATKQFYLDASTGKAYAGAGSVVFDTDGLSIVSGQVAANFLKWKSGATTVGKLYGFISGNDYNLYGVIGPPASAAGYASFELKAEGSGVDNATLVVRSAKTGAVGVISATVGSYTVFSAKELYLQCHRPIRLDAFGAHPAAPANGVLLYHYTGGGRNALFIQWGDGVTAEIINHP